MPELTERITFTVTAAQKHLIVQAAASEQVTVSQFVREAVMIDVQYVLDDHDVEVQW